MQKGPADILQQERYRVLIDHATQPMLILDVEIGKFIDHNHQAESFFKLSGDQLRELGPADLSPALVAGKNAVLYSDSLIQKALDGGQAIFPWVHKDSSGREIPCEISLVRFPPYERRLISATIIDKTGSQEIKQALAESQERLKLALEVTGLGTFDWDFQEHTLLWDDQMDALHGLGPETETDRLKYLFSVLHPEDKHWIKDRLSHAAQPNVDLTSFDKEYRIVLQRKTRYLQINGSFFRNAAGEILRAVGTVRDVTAGKETREQMIYQAALLKNVSEAVISTDDLFIIRSWNNAAEKLYGWSAEEMIGRSILGIETDYLDQNDADVLSTFQKDGYWRGEVIQKGKDDRSFHLLSSVSTMRDEAGKEIGYVAVNRDITKEKEAEKQQLRARQLELKNKELEQVAYVVSHDLQEPLHTVKGFVRLLDQRLHEHLDDRSEEYVERINESVDRMYNLIRALLDYSRIGLYEKTTEVNTNSLLEDLEVDLEDQIRETNALIRYEALPVVVGYETELRVLFQNLIINAIKFSKPEVAPEIRITALSLQEGWEFCITDNGIGIPGKHHQRIFAIFHRLHPAAQYPGTGIGLSHAQKIVELHGGKIWVKSIPGVGSQFYFTLAK